MWSSEPSQAATWHERGLLALQRGDAGEAVESLRRAIELQDDVPEFHGNLGSAYVALRQWDDAIRSYQRAVELQPDYADGWQNLGRVLYRLGRFNDALSSTRQAARSRPESPDVQYDLARIWQALEQPTEAIACYQRALRGKPKDAETHNRLGTVWQAVGNLDEAIGCYRRAIDCQPEFVAAWNNLGVALTKAGRLSDAVAAFRRALQLRPEFSTVLVNLGSVHQAQGDIDQALACFQRAVELEPANVEAHDNWLMARHYHPQVTLAELHAAHVAFETAHAAPLRTTWRAHENTRDPDRRLRIGFVSPDLCRHPVGYFLLPVLEHLDRRECEIHCYSCDVRRDDVTARLQATDTVWHEVAKHSVQQLADQIRADRMDVLFDLAGHTRKNRLLVFARKPAPIQVTWAGYVGTTGLTAMDFLLADRYQIPFGTETFHVETLLRMPDGYVCFDPPAEAPPVGPLPALRNGFVTFGCFNNPGKLSPVILVAWREVMERVENSRLLLKFRGYDDPGTAKRVLEVLCSNGVRPERIELVGHSPRRELLEHYNRVDIALDTVPYSGGLTTCEALWMGVPVITAPGETFASRHSLTHVTTTGLTETIAKDLDEYVEIAVNLSHDLARLATIRIGLRDRVQTSPLCDAPRFARNLLTIVRAIWRHWCQFDFCTLCGQGQNLLPDAEPAERAEHARE